MNRVTTKTKSSRKTKLQAVVDSGHTAFVGRCGNGPEDTLYLISHRKIIQADAPNRCWSCNECDVVVDRYVDVEIREI